MEKMGVATNKKTGRESCEYGSDSHVSRCCLPKPAQKKT